MGYENQILNHAIAAFKNTTNLLAEVLAEEIRLPAGIADAEIRLADADPLLVEIKKTLRPATLGVAMAQLQRFRRPGVLVTDYITPQIAEKLKELDIPFLDIAGIDLC